MSVTPPANSGDQVKRDAYSGGDATQDVKQRDDLGHFFMSLLRCACGFRTQAYAGKAAGDAQEDNQREVRYTTAVDRAIAGK
ncbi:TPA: hypothetical protein ACLEB8_004801 [Pseudomonas aeruginosa]